MPLAISDSHLHHYKSLTQNRLQAFQLIGCNIISGDTLPLPGVISRHNRSRSDIVGNAAQHIMISEGAGKRKPALFPCKYWLVSFECWNLYVLFQVLRISRRPVPATCRFRILRLTWADYLRVLLKLVNIFGFSHNFCKDIFCRVVRLKDDSGKWPPTDLLPAVIINIMCCFR